MISVIVPVYNVKDYLKRCVDSITSQDYKDLEIILVDDGSTDGSEGICAELAVQDSRIKVIHKENGGLSSARNTGIKVARGKYIAFVDSDDFLHEEYISVMHDIAVESGAEMVICDYEKGKKNTFSEEQTDNPYKLYTSEQMLENWHSGLCTQETVAWCKLILRDVLIKISFQYPEGFFYEDVRTTHLLVEATDEIAVVDRKLYYYYQRKNSIAKRLGNEKNIRDKLEALDSRLDFFKTRGYESTVHRLMIGRQKYYMLMYCLTNSWEIKKKLKILFWDSYKSLIGFSETTWLEKIMFIVFNIFFVHNNLGKGKC